MTPRMLALLAPALVAGGCTIVVEAESPPDPEPAPDADPLRRVGNWDDFGDVALVNPDVVFGHRVVLDGAATLHRLAVITGGAGPALRLALYQGDDEPTTLVADTGVFAASFERTEIDVAATALAAGTYWIVIHASEPVLLHRTVDGDADHETAVLLAHPFGDGVPASTGDFVVLDDHHYNLYAVIEPAP